MKLHPASIPPETAHRYVTRVYYEDTDAGGVVYHATYLGMAERARTEALRDLGVPHADLTREHGLMFVVRRLIIDYLAPARLDDSLAVMTWADVVGRARLGLRQTFLHADQPVAALEVGLACVRRDDSRPGGLAVAGIPDRWRAALASLAERKE
jgi:acyl-CoA thioester hydrolase